jgi:hypothetical protein
MLNPAGRLARAKYGRYSLREIEEAMARRVIAGSEHFVRRHQARWTGTPRAVRVDEVQMPLWGAQPWRRTFL